MRVQELCPSRSKGNALGLKQQKMITVDNLIRIVFGFFLPVVLKLWLCHPVTKIWPKMFSNEGYLTKG